MLMAKKKYAFVSIVMVIAMICGMIMPVSAANETPNYDTGSFLEMLVNRPRNVRPFSTYGEYSLTWENGGPYGHVVLAKTNSMIAEYEYNDDNQRISKTVDGVTTSFTYADTGAFVGKLISENRNGTIITYDYITIDDRIVPHSFSLNGNTYYYELDDDSTVQAILDCNGEIVCTYIYSDNKVTSILEKDESGEWIENSSDSNSIGNINLIRYLGYYFDDETQWYYCGRMYDPSSDCFINGIMDIEEITIPYSNWSVNNTPDSINSTNYTPDEVLAEVMALYDSCYYDPNFGKAISHYQGWYSSLSDVEVLSRLIYGENGYSGRNNERRAIAWVVANRVLSSAHPNNIKSVCTQANQFQPITGNTADETVHARVPDTSSAMWTDAVSIACTVVVAFRYVSNSENYLGDLMPRPNGITNQRFFVGLEYFKAVYQVGNNCLRYNLGTGYLDLKKVVVVDVNTNITTSAQINAISPAYLYNIFFDYE